MTNSSSSESDGTETLPDRLSGIEVARLLRIKPATVRKCWQEFGLVRVGRSSHGRHLYSKESVQRHIRERKLGIY
ncbi:MAG: MerR family transcriptional regulator [Opitutaceae bacterium]